MTSKTKEKNMAMQKMTASSANTLGDELSSELVIKVQDGDLFIDTPYACSVKRRHFNATRPH